MIKTLGYRVSPDEIVDVLHASGEVSEAVVAPDGRIEGKQHVAFVVLRDGGRLDRLEAFCKTELPRYMQPARFEVRTELRVPTAASTTSAQPLRPEGRRDPRLLRRDAGLARAVRGDPAARRASRAPAV